mmetsp:Transcript_7988/g.12074  ORF Transcript_7988/g.12074 Transcript_7988/m.12074 type:complete len:201 (+) Transcript_7988:1829-2431(+)
MTFSSLAIEPFSFVSLFDKSCVFAFFSSKVKTFPFLCLAFGEIVFLGGICSTFFADFGGVLRRDSGFSIKNGSSSCSVFCLERSGSCGCDPCLRSIFLSLYSFSIGETTGGVFAREWVFKGDERRKLDRLPFIKRSALGSGGSSWRIAWSCCIRSCISVTVAFVSSLTFGIIKARLARAIVHFTQTAYQLGFLMKFLQYR